MTPRPTLEVHDLTVTFDTDQGVVRAVDGVSFEVAPGETLGLVGESGSGKTVSNLAILDLIPRPAGRIVRGSILFEGRELRGMKPRELRSIRGDGIAMIFQDPMTSLNPFISVGRQLCEVLQVHRGLSRREARAEALAGLAAVSIAAPEERLDAFPHELSGGMCQRVMIAMALLCKPRILLADEPTTALDVTIQAQIMELLSELQARNGMSILMITHDLGVVAGMADRVHVMYGGKLVETGPTRELFARPLHPYTRGLLASVPRLTDPPGQPLQAIPGQPPDPGALPSGCAFRERCELAHERCREEEPRLEVREGDARRCACHAHEQPAVPGAALGGGPE